MPIMERPENGPPDLATSKEPVASKNRGTPTTVGNIALNDALLLVGLAWLVLILLYVSLRSHNI